MYKRLAGISTMKRKCVRSLMYSWLQNQQMADRGFAIEEELALQGAKLTIPASTWGKKQLLQKDVELSDMQMSAFSRGTYCRFFLKIDTSFYNPVFQLL